MKPPKLTSLEVAQLAQVSQATVSRALRDSPLVKPETRARVQEIAREIRVSLDFLDAGRNYTAEIYRDGDDAHWQGRADSVVIEKRRATRADAWPFRLAPGGGLAIRFVAEPRHGGAVVDPARMR